MHSTGLEMGAVGRRAPRGGMGRRAPRGGGFKDQDTIIALAGNRTRASRVAGENSTTEPPMRHVGAGVITLLAQLV